MNAAGALCSLHLVEWQDPKGTLFFGVAVAVVSASLIAFSHFGGRD